MTNEKINNAFLGFSYDHTVKTPADEPLDVEFIDTAAIEAPVETPSNSTPDPTPNPIPNPTPKSTSKSTPKPEITTQPSNPPQFRYKQVILVRTDLNLSPGKLAAQVAHASVNAFNVTSPLTRKSWLDEGHRKIVLRVADDVALTHYLSLAKSAGLPVALITDFGLTELPPNTSTTLAIGPALNEAIDPLTVQLKLL